MSVTLPLNRSNWMHFPSILRRTFPFIIQYIVSARCAFISWLPLFIYVFLSRCYQLSVGFVTTHSACAVWCAVLQFKWFTVACNNSIWMACINVDAANLSHAHWQECFPVWPIANLACALTTFLLWFISGHALIESHRQSGRLHDWNSRIHSWVTLTIIFLCAAYCLFKCPLAHIQCVVNLRSWQQNYIRWL